jgi:hypothetical protein
MECGCSVDSPEGRRAEDLEEAADLCVEMDLRCRKCDGPVTMRVTPETEDK